MRILVPTVSRGCAGVAIAGLLSLSTALRLLWAHDFPRDLWGL